MEWIPELESTCAALGTSDGVQYHKDPECLECVKDLIRFLRRDDGSHLIRRNLGKIAVVQSDLIPLVRDFVEDQELFDLVLRLLVNLTGPELLLFREELPDDKVTRNHFIELQTHRQAYKKAFIDEKLWVVLAQQLGKLLRKEFNERSEDDGMVIERILILVRNILQVPRDSMGERRTDGEASLHDQILWVLHKSGMEDLLLFVASSQEETQYCLHVLEIISLMFREQEPKHLASANFQRSKDEKQQDEQALLRLREKEMEKQRLKFHEIKSTRHSRFGGTFSVANVKSISDKSLIYHRPLTSMDNLNFDKNKRPVKLARNRRTPDDPEANKRRSTLAIRLFLKEFCVEFLHAAYNNLMSVVKDNLVRQRAQNNDETYYLWSLRFFMEFNREYKFRPDLVVETLNKSSFHFVQNQLQNYKDNYDHEKKNRPMCLIWARRMHLAVRAYQELLMSLVAMVSEKDEKVRQSGLVLRADVFYEAEYRELCLNQLSLYQPEKMSMSYLKDIVETTHAFLKLMEHMSKSKHIMVSKKQKKVKPRKNTKKASARDITGSGDGFLSQRESNEQKWDQVSNELSALLQGSSENLPEIVSPFDAASDITIEDQKVCALVRIQDALKAKKCGEAIALLRASRELWPENDSFGAKDAELEDEYMAMREILFAEIERPKNMTLQNENEEEDPREDDAANNIFDQPELEDEEEENEEEMVLATTTVEQEFDFNGFVERFAVKSVCSTYALLLAKFDTNSDFTNHCLIKMFHRIAFDLKLPGLLYHVSILRSFQRIHKDYQLNPSNSKIREMNKFAKHILHNFFEVCKTNKHIWMEICFWKTSREAKELVDGYGTQVSSSKSKKSYWSEEDEEKLARVYHQVKEMEKDDSVDKLDSITFFFTESGKSRRQVAKKLKEMGLIQNSKELSNKPIKARAPIIWGDEEIEQLKQLYEEYKDAVAPVNRIIDHLIVKRPKKRVIEKIMELQLCTDKKKLMKKKVRRGLKDEDPGSASETDSAMEDSSSGEESKSDDDERLDVSKNLSNAKEIIETLSVEGGNETPLKWLKKCFDDEKEDREEDSDFQDVPILPMTEECIVAMERTSFTNFLKFLQLTPPNDQEQYWRIPASLSIPSLEAKSNFVQKIVDGDLDMENLDLSLIANVVQQDNKKEKRKQKRGPNKWMPMRRTVDPEVQNRIRQAVGLNDKEESPEGSAKKPTSKKKTKKSPSSAKKRIKVHDDSSEEEVMDSQKDDGDDGASDSDNSSTNRRKSQNQKRLLHSSSDEEGNEKENQVPIPEGTNRHLGKSDDDSDNNDDHEESKNPNVSRRNRFMESSSESEEEKKKSQSPIKQQKSARLGSSSSSDEGVDDPWPSTRPPSDTDHEDSTTTNDVTNASVALDQSMANTSRRSSRSMSSSSSRSSRSRSNSPQVMVSLNNTPKRPRSSPTPSPMNSGKKLKKSTSVSSSDDEEIMSSKRNMKVSKRVLSSDESD